MGSVEKYLANGSPDEFGDFDLWGLEICKRAASRYKYPKFACDNSSLQEMSSLQLN
jgi:hypothetical protein